MTFAALAWISSQSCMHPVEITDAYPNAESGVRFSVTTRHRVIIFWFYIFDVENLGRSCAVGSFDQISKVTVNVNDAGYVQALVYIAYE